MVCRANDCPNFRGKQEALNQLRNVESELQQALDTVEVLARENESLKRQCEVIWRQKLTTVESKKKIEEEYAKWKEWGERILTIDE